MEVQAPSPEAVIMIADAPGRKPRPLRLASVAECDALIIAVSDAKTMLLAAAAVLEPVEAVIACGSAEPLPDGSWSSWGCDLPEHDETVAHQRDGRTWGGEDDGRHPDGCGCQFCAEDEREERAALDRQDAGEPDDDADDDGSGTFDDAAPEPVYVRAPDPQDADDNPCLCHHGEGAHFIAIPEGRREGCVRCACPCYRTAPAVVAGEVEPHEARVLAAAAPESWRERWEGPDARKLAQASAERKRLRIAGREWTAGVTA